MSQSFSPRVRALRSLLSFPVAAWNRKRGVDAERFDRPIGPRFEPLESRLLLDATIPSNVFTMQINGGAAIDLGQATWEAQRELEGITPNGVDFGSPHFSTFDVGLVKEAGSANVMLDTLKGTTLNKVTIVKSTAGGSNERITIDLEDATFTSYQTSDTNGAPLQGFDAYSLVFKKIHIKIEGHDHNDEQITTFSEATFFVDGSGANSVTLDDSQLKNDKEDIQFKIGNWNSDQKKNIPLYAYTWVTSRTDEIGSNLRVISGDWSSLYFLKGMINKLDDTATLSDFVTAQQRSSIAVGAQVWTLSDDVWTTAFRMALSSGSSDLFSTDSLLSFGKVRQEVNAPAKSDPKAIVKGDANWDFLKSKGTGAIALNGSAANGVARSMQVDKLKPIEVVHFDWNQSLDTESGEPTAGVFSVMLKRGELSPSFMLAVQGETLFKSLVLTSHDGPNRKDVVFTLTDVRFTQYETSNSGGAGSLGYDTLRVTARVVKMSYYYEGKLKTEGTWDSVKGAGSGTTNFAGRDLLGTSNEEQVLDFGTGQIALQSYSWGVDNPTETGGFIRAVDRPSISNLFINANASTASVGIFLTAATGNFLPQIKLFTRAWVNGAMRVVSRITLFNVQFHSYQNYDQSNGARGDTFSLSFSKIQQETIDPLTGTATNSASWDVQRNIGSGGAPLVGTGTNNDKLTMSAGGKPIVLESFEWGLAATLRAGGGSGGVSNGPPTQDFKISLRGASLMPALLLAIGRADTIDRVTILRRDAPGRVIEEVRLEHVRFVSADIGDGANDNIRALINASLEFERISLLSTTYNSKGVATTTTLEYDARTNRGNNPGLGSSTANIKSDQLVLNVNGTQIPVTAYNWGVSTEYDPGHGVSKPTASDFSISLNPSPASAGIAAALISGQRFNTVTLTSRDFTANQPGAIYAVWTFTNVTFTGYSLFSSLQTAPGLREVVSFTFTAVEQKLFISDGKGNYTGVIRAAWDFARNRAV